MSYKTDLMIIDDNPSKYFQPRGILVPWESGISVLLRYVAVVDNGWLVCIILIPLFYSDSAKISKQHKRIWRMR
jgi:hypothetical protein